MGVVDGGGDGLVGHGGSIGSSFLFSAKGKLKRRVAMPSSAREDARVVIKYMIHAGPAPCASVMMNLAVPEWYIRPKPSQWQEIPELIVDGRSYKGEFLLVAGKPDYFEPEVFHTVHHLVKGIKSERFIHKAICMQLVTLYNVPLCLGCGKYYHRYDLQVLVVLNFG